MISLETRLGAWIMSLGNAVVLGDATIKDDFDTVSIASRAGRFYSAIRSLPSVSSNRLEAYRKESGLTRPELSPVLDSLARHGIIELAQDPDGLKDIASVKASGVPAVYDFAAIFYKEQGQNACADVALGILDVTMAIPTRLDILYQEISTNFSVDTKTITLARRHLEFVGAINVTRETDSGQPIVYNPLQHSADNAEALKRLSSLTGPDRDQVLEIMQYVRERPGVPIPAHLRGSAYIVLKNTGIIEASVYSPRLGDAPHEFPTLREAWGKITYADASETSDDLVHDAKALLASIRYGEHFALTSGGRIKSPYALLNKLLRDGSVGPATNIGTDYPLIARRGIINIVEHPSITGRYSMELVKQDVVDPVLQLFRNELGKDTETAYDDALADTIYSFKSPEENRKQSISEDIVFLRDAIIFEQLTFRR